MRTVYTYILYIVALATVLSACSRIELPGQGNTGMAPEVDMSHINAVCVMETPSARPGSKALIDQVTTRQLNANFLRVDEEMDNSYNALGTYFMGTDFLGGGNPQQVNWEQAYLSTATVISSPDNTEGIHYRSIIFSPQQPYRLYTERISTEPVAYDTTRFYHTRMVGWYPQNCALVQVDGTQMFEFSYSNNEDGPLQNKYYTDEGGHKFKAVKFSGLNGATDVMVSNVCEAQHWHSRSSTYSPHAEDPQNMPYAVPMGHYQQYDERTGNFTTKYSNYFKFRHYLSGVRFWGFVPEQNSHALDMWGKINDVVLLNQPTSVSVSLPEIPEVDANGNSLSWALDTLSFNNPMIWGQAFDWCDEQNFSVQTGPMFGDDTNHSSEAYTVDFSKINMDGIGDVNSAVYLGYSLVQPDHSVQVQIHTRYGVYVTTISNKYTYKNFLNEDVTVDIFKPGCYYDVYLSLQTDGTIAALIENRGDEKYYDLTRNVEVDHSGTPTGTISTYQYANSYVVDPMAYDFNEDGKCDYSGFFFSGLVPGNGGAGMVTVNSLPLYPNSAFLSPVSAHLVWESSRLLVTKIELINGYVSFKVPSFSDPDNYSAGRYIGPKGNAVIGVFDENDVCLWSWHIWITDKPADLTYTTSQGTELTFMDRNLGATYGGVPTTNAQALDSYGLYYQWGRKDPSIGPSDYKYSQKDAGTASYYDYSSDEMTSSNPKMFNAPSLKNSVENPMYLILPSRKLSNNYLYDWLNYGPENVLWGHNHYTGTTTKTIYDPCPFGYRVPVGELETLMTTATYTTPNSSSYGITFNGNIFFPFAGYKGVDKGIPTLSSAWAYVGEKGDYQEALYDESDAAIRYNRKRLYISRATTWTERQTLGNANYQYGSNIAPARANIYSDYTNRRTATSVRCVKDAEFGDVNVNISTSKTRFTALESITVNLYASSSSSTLSNIKFSIKHNVDDEVLSTQVFNEAPRSSNWSRAYTFVAPDEEYLATTDSTYTFRFEATNEFGITTFKEVDISCVGKEPQSLRFDTNMEVYDPEWNIANFTEPALLGAMTAVTYSSSDPSSVSVNSTTGEITVIKPSAAPVVITATAASNAQYKSATASYKIQPRKVSAGMSFAATQDPYTPVWWQVANFEEPALTGVQGDRVVSYSSSDPSAVSVDSDGNVTLNAASASPVTITASAPETEYYAGFIASYRIQPQKATRTLQFSSATYEVEVNGNNTTTVAPGSVTVSASPSETHAGGSDEITYSITGGGHATLSSVNVVTAGTSYGKETLTATIAENEYYNKATANAVVEIYQYVYHNSAFTPGSYVIASGSSGTINMLGIGDNNSVTTQQATVSGSVLSGAIPKASVVKISSSGTSNNIQSYEGELKLNSSNQNNAPVAWNGSGKSWTISANASTCSFTYWTRSYYLNYNNGFKVSTSSKNVYFFRRRCE